MKTSNRYIFERTGDIAWDIRYNLLMHTVYSKLDRAFVEARDGGYWSKTNWDFTDNIRDSICFPK